MSFELFPENRKDKHERNKFIQNLFSSGRLSFMTLYNNMNVYDKNLNTLASIFQQQLPKMPKEYIFRQVFDPKHKNLALLSDNKITGGICYRPFYDKYFVEVVFCAIEGEAQIKGYGGFMMNFLKEAIKTEAYMYLKEQENIIKQEKAKRKSKRGNKTKKAGSFEGINTKDPEVLDTLETRTTTDSFENKKTTQSSDRKASIEDFDNITTAESVDTKITGKPVDTKIMPECDNTETNNAARICNNFNTTDSCAKGDKQPLSNVQHHRIKGQRDYMFASEEACKVLGLDVKTYTAESIAYLNPMYKKNKIPIYIMTYADNYAIGYFKKNGFKTEITFKNWVGCIKDYDGGTLMQCKVIWDINYLKKDEFIESLKTKLITAMSSISEFNVERKLFPDDADMSKVANDANVVKSFYKTPYDIPGVREAKFTDMMLVKKSSNERLADILKFFLNDLQAHSSAWPFLQPVKKSEVPDYYTVITKPMDLSTMENKLKNNAYKTIKDFYNDFKLIIKNCCIYNAPSTQYYKCAQKIDEYFEKKVSHFDF